MARVNSYVEDEECGDITADAMNSGPLFLTRLKLKIRLRELGLVWDSWREIAEVDVLAIRAICSITRAMDALSWLLRTRRR